MECADEGVGCNLHISLIRTEAVRNCCISRHFWNLKLWKWRGFCILIGGARLRVSWRSIHVLLTMTSRALPLLGFQNAISRRHVQVATRSSCPLWFPSVTSSAAKGGDQWRGVLAGGSAAPVTASEPIDILSQVEHFGVSRRGGTQFRRKGAGRAECGRSGADLTAALIKVMFSGCLLVCWSMATLLQGRNR